MSNETLKNSLESWAAKSTDSQLDKLIQTFELRIKTHKKNGMRYFNNHQNNESLVCLGKQKEAQFILTKLKALK